MKYIFFLFCMVICVNTISAQYSLRSAFPNLPTFSNPTEMRSVPGGTNQFVVLEKGGRAWIFDNTPAVSTRTLFFDARPIVSQDACEGGLLGCAFHPDYIYNHYIFLSYTTGSSPQWYSHIVRYYVVSDTIVPSSALDILSITQPTGRCNHKGGCLQFGNDGYLYASFGDGGSGGDPDGNGQKRSVMLGKILRLDVDHEANGNHYAIPSDNPFAANTQGFKKEIYAYGLRNTWKFSFDHVTGKLWAADVGQNVYEEVDTISNGGNYGWNIMEGYHCYPSGSFDCDSTGLIPPIWEYPHTNSNVSITGGYVYRGTMIPSLVGKYIYGDYGSGRVWALTANSSPATNQLLVDKQNSTLQLSGFSEDENHEIYFVCIGNGKLYKLISSEIGDTLPPLFTNEPGLDAYQQNIKVRDNRPADNGIESMRWSAIGNSGGSFLVSYTPAITSCPENNAVYTISFVQVDSTVAGCYGFIFNDCAGNKSYDTLCFQAHVLKGVTNDTHSSLTLEANRPNPFSRHSTITYSTAGYGMVRLNIYDELGREVTRIIDRTQEQGRHSLDFDGSKLPAGSYTLRLESGGKVVSRKIVKE